MTSLRVPNSKPDTKFRESHLYNNNGSSNSFLGSGDELKSSRKSRSMERDGYKSHYNDKYSMQSSNSRKKSLRPPDLPQPVRPRSRIESLHRMLLKEPTPSAFDYNPNISLQFLNSGGVSFGKSKRFQEKRDITPSAVDYQSVFTEDHSPRRRKTMDSSHNSGRNTSPNQSPRKETFSLAPRFTSKHEKSPSVWSYDVESAWKKTAQKSKSPTFPRSKRDSLANRSISPDPTKYAPKMKFVHLPQRPKSRASLKGQNNTFTNNTSRYSQNQTSPRRSLAQDVRRFSLSNSPQSKYRMEPAFSFGTSPKLKNSPKPVPGPQYDSHLAKDRISNSIISGTFSRSKRVLHQKSSEASPSPLDYRPETASSLVYYKTSTTLFSKDKRRVSQFTTLSKGPGAYNVDSHFDSRNQQNPQPVFSKAPREVNCVKSDVPSVFHYSPKYSPFEKSRSAILYLTG